MITELTSRQREAIDVICSVVDAEDAIAPILRELENAGFSKQHLAEILGHYAHDLRDGLEIL